MSAARRARTPRVTLAVLMGPGERENLVPFFWQFRDWPGDIVVLDDETRDGAGPVLATILSGLLGLPGDRYRVLRAPLKGDFGAARNLLHDAAQARWVLTADVDERWDPRLLTALPDLVSRLERARKIVCGFPRANFIDGVLVNDVPDAQWTEEGLLSALRGLVWPPKNRDVQYRLMRKEERWAGTIHEWPARLSARASDVATLEDFWILHSKSYARQRRQDSFYRSLGQSSGMPTGGGASPRPRRSRASLRRRGR